MDAIAESQRVIVDIEQRKISQNVLEIERREIRPAGKLAAAPPVLPVAQ